MDVLLIRHAAALDAGSVPGGDAARPLSPAGRRQFEAASAWLAQRGVRPERIIHSPRLRARQTAEILAAAIGAADNAMASEYWLGEGMPLADSLALIRREAPLPLAIVGHEPDMSQTAVDLVGGGRFVFRPGTILCVRFDGTVAAGLGRVNWLLAADLFAAE